MDITWTKKALRLPEHVRKEIFRRLDTLLPYFPEVCPQMEIGLTYHLEGFAHQSCNGHVRLGLEVRRQKGDGWHLPTYWTIAHELMHLVQFDSDDIPEEETAIDMFALARLPPKFIDESPTYLYVPPGARKVWTEDDAELAHTLAEVAVTKVEEGGCVYVSYWEDEFERIYLAD